MLPLLLLLPSLCSSMLPLLLPLLGSSLGNRHPRLLGSIASTRGLASCLCSVSNNSTWTVSVYIWASMLIFLFSEWCAVCQMTFYTDQGSRLIRNIWTGMGHLLTWTQEDTFAGYLIQRQWWTCLKRSSRNTSGKSSDLCTRTLHPWLDAADAVKASLCSSSLPPPTATRSWRAGSSRTEKISSAAFPTASTET